jgi:putative transposase
MRFAENEGQILYVTCATNNRVRCLDNEAAAKVILSGLDFARSRDHLKVHAWVIMPDHFHVLASLPGGGNMATLVASLKSWTARQLVDMWTQAGLNELLGRFRMPEPKAKRHVYRVWGRGSFPVAVFSHRFVRQKVRYMHRNPEAAGLVPTPDQWPFSDYVWWAYGQEVPLTPDPIEWLLDPVY